MITQDKWLNLNEEFLVLFVISLSFKEKNWVSNGPNDISALGQQIISWREKTFIFGHFFLSFFSAEESPVQKQLLIRDKFRTKTRKISRIVAEKGLEGLQDKAIEPAS